MLSKVIFGLLGATMVVGIAIGVVVSVNRMHIIGNGDDFSEDGGGDPSFLTASKSTNSFCTPTNFPDTCKATLDTALNGTANARDVVHVTVQAINEQIQAAFNLSDEVGKKATDDMDKQAIEICKKCLQDAADDLDATIDSTKDLPQMLSSTDDISTRLSAVITYQDICIEALQQPDLKSQMDTGLMNATQITSNALAIVAVLGQLYKKFADIKLPGLSADSSRRRLEEGGMPGWVAGGDRKLIEAARPMPAPNAVVAMDGSGQYKTVGQAISAIPKGFQGRYVIHVKAGTYKENVLIDNTKPSILMYGDGSRSSVITGSKNFVDGVQTFATATIAIESDNFMAVSMGFANTAGAPKHQAVALRSKGDKSVFHKCRFDGYQDTLYPQVKRQFFRNCVVSGTIDYVFGDAAMVMQNCLFIVRRPMDNQQNTVTASGRKDSKTNTGIVIHNSRIVPALALFPDRLKIPTYLGRPWKQFARTIVMESELGDLIHTDGWMPWNGDFALKTLFYAEYNNRGPGAGTSARVKWPGFHVINRAAASGYTVERFLQASTWLNSLGVRYIPNLRF